MHTQANKISYSELCSTLTVSQIVYIADQLGISYIQALSFVNKCRRSGKGVQSSLQQLVCNYHINLCH